MVGYCLSAHFYPYRPGSCPGLSDGNRSKTDFICYVCMHGCACGTKWLSVDSFDGDASSVWVPGLEFRSSGLPDSALPS